MKGDTLAEPEQAEQNNEELGEDQDKKTSDVFSQEIMAVNTEVKQAAKPKDGIDLRIELQQVFITPAFAPGHDAANHIANYSVKAQDHDSSLRKIHESKHEQQHSRQEP